MRILVGRLGRPTLGLVLLAVVMLCGGCRTATKSLFTVSGPGWDIQQGQALWRPRQGYPELGGDLLFARDGQGRCLIQFAKTPMSLVSAQTTPKQWRIEFPPRNWSFSGHRRPPTRFVWLYLPSALAGEPLPSALRFARKPEGGWRLENVRSGETVEGFLAP